ncbi:hypothetical protein CLV59_109314 [Chitinophaga dinghuensis]|uniref:Uncharacterized protein n=1 Tax=Chitinophaga dinghuensis TaxID=1539050 RepID=A0A327VLR1_9BACT|nr:hypothetical protein CLV59_109314 [Chitinophaga dinghuensis]
MEQRTYSKTHSPLRLSLLKAQTVIKSFRNISTEWKLLYGLLLVMALRLAVIIVFIINQC